MANYFHYNNLAKRIRNVGNNGLINQRKPSKASNIRKLNFQTLCPLVRDFFSSSDNLCNFSYYWWPDANSKDSNNDRWIYDLFFTDCKLFDDNCSAMAVSYWRIFQAKGQYTGFLCYLNAFYNCLSLICHRNNWKRFIKFNAVDYGHSIQRYIHHKLSNLHFIP